MLDDIRQYPVGLAERTEYLSPDPLNRFKACHYVLAKLGDLLNSLRAFAAFAHFQN